VSIERANAPVVFYFAMVFFSVLLLYTRPPHHVAETTRRKYTFCLSNTIPFSPPCVYPLRCAEYLSDALPMTKIW
jgi:hypothetical protein